MLLPHRQSKTAYRFGAGLDFRMAPSIALVRSFMDHLWSEPRSPAKIYIQDYQLPAILTYVADGTYAEAMRTDADMEAFASYMAQRQDDAENMDF